MSEWISVKEKMPKEQFNPIQPGYPLKYLVANAETGFVDAALFYRKRFYVSGTVTHWMPLPEAPK